jgi:hypothetical protein
MYHARGVVAATQIVSGQTQKEIEALKDGDSSTKLWAENWYDGLTYCESKSLKLYLVQLLMTLQALGMLLANDLVRRKSSKLWRP